MALLLAWLAEASPCKATVAMPTVRRRERLAVNASPTIDYIHDTATSVIEAFSSCALPKQTGQPRACVMDLVDAAASPDGNTKHLNQADHVSPG